MQPDPAFDEHGNLHRDAWINIFAALLLKSGGQVVLSEDDLQASNLQQIEYEQTETGIRFTICERRCGES